MGVEVVILTYTNRKGVEHYLHVRKTKAGKERFYFSSKPKGPFCDRVPDGYEIHESPNGRVSLRRKRESLVTDEELKTVENGLRRFTSLRPYQYKTDHDRSSITVLLLDPDLEQAVPKLRPDLAGDHGYLSDLAAKLGTYTAMMRFSLADAEKRSFQAERFCFMGGIDDWIPIGPEGPLVFLAGKFVKHLGKESFYELD